MLSHGDCQWELTLVRATQLLNSIFSGSVSQYEQPCATYYYAEWLTCALVSPGIAEMTFAVERLPTFFKHRNNVCACLWWPSVRKLEAEALCGVQRLFPVWAYVVPTSLTRIPASLVETLAFSLIAVRGPHRHARHMLLPAAPP